MVRKEAYGQVEKGLAGIKMTAQFFTEELKSAAADAELNYLLYQHDEKLISEVSVRRDFATILQGIGCVVADLSEDLLRKKDLLDALDDQYYNHLDGRHERDVHLYWRDRLTDLSYDLGCDLRDWDYIPGRLVDLNKFLKTVSYPSGRHTLGTAFICWCAVRCLAQLVRRLKIISSGWAVLLPGCLICQPASMLSKISETTTSRSKRVVGPCHWMIFGWRFMQSGVH